MIIPMRVHEVKRFAGIFGGFDIEEQIFIPDGWVVLVHHLCELLSRSVDLGHPPLCIERITRWDGRLIVDGFHGSDYQKGMIRFAGYMSNFTCEVCGSAGVARYSGSGSSVLCKQHQPLLNGKA